jgi:replicative DNA helicase
MSFERTIFTNLLNNEEYARKVIPFLASEYFHDQNERAIFKTIQSYVEQYKGFPSKEALLIDLSNRKDLDDSQFDECKDYVTTIPTEKDEVTSIDWLVDNTEKFCQDKAIHNAIFDSIKIMDGQDERLDRGAIPKLLADALAVSFNTDLGHDYLEDIESRYEFYHNVEEKIPFDLEYLNKITKGGFPRKEMMVLVAATGVGKSAAMCHLAAANLVEGRNVLYVTMEMAKEKIAERIDVNLMNVSFDDLQTMPKDAFVKKAKRIKEKTVGRLIIEEYPTGTASAASIRYLINELKIKKGFVPDVLYVDYLNICASSRYRGNNQANSYTVIKAVAEELRALAVEFNMAVITATQTTRDGIYSSDVDLTNISESIGVAHTAGMILALVSTPELEALHQILVIQLKNRYNDLNYYRRFVLGIDRGHMRFYNVEQSAQQDIMQEADITKSTPSNNKSIDKSKFQNFS